MGGQSAEKGQQTANMNNAAGKRPQGQGLRATKLKEAQQMRVAAIPINGVCMPCHNTLTQKKINGSYVPLRQPAKCAGCGQKAVLSAYYTYCSACASSKRVCPKCGSAQGAHKARSKEQDEIRELTAKLAEGGMNERQRRSTQRKIEKLKEAAKQGHAQAQDKVAVCVVQ